MAAQASPQPLTSHNTPTTAQQIANMSANSTIRTNFTQINAANNNINSSIAGQGNTGNMLSGTGTQQGLLAGRRRRASEWGPLDMLYM